MILDEIQTSIVESSADNIVVSAGAGSGKTRVLTERIKHLLDIGVKPENIVAFTFTKMAADEMLQRLSNIKDIDKMFIGTLHAFANLIYHRTGKQFNIMSDEAESYFMSNIVKDSNVHISYKMYTDFKSMRYDSGKVWNIIFDKYGFDKMKELRHIVEYEPNEEFPITIKGIAKSNNYITFDELIQQCTDYYTNAGISIDYLFIDEFQDIGNLEYEFIKSLNAKHNFVVGDKNQAIYGFKGATDRYFDYLLHDTKWTQFYLTNNYRSAKRIINFAETILDCIYNIFDEPFIKANSLSKEQGNINYIKDSTLLNKLNLDRGNLTEWFILCRSNKEVEFYINFLEDNNIPCTTFKKSEMSFDDMNKLMSKNSVKVLTVHSAKGLENKNVFVTYCSPEQNYGRKPKIDEYKLYYVACTRAKTNLYLTKERHNI